MRRARTSIAVPAPCRRWDNGRTSTMSETAGTPCWMDLLTSDTARAREFYGRIFGWHGAEASEEFGGYFMFTLDGAPVAGCMPAMPSMDVADVWGTYLATPDATG